jgi:MOSC domain-containing protein YiiM
LGEKLFGENIVWGKRHLVKTSFGENIVWEKCRLGKILFGKNVVWGTVVWGKDVVPTTPCPLLRY